MPLLVSLRRESASVELESVDRLALTRDELHRSNGERSLLARHRHNRWMKADDAEPYVRLQVLGPLVVTGDGPAAERVGPYRTLSTFDGVAYVDDRVFGFFDAQHQDWYVVDVGEHWKELIIAFHPSD